MNLDNIFGLVVRYRNLAGNREKIEKKVTFMYLYYIIHQALYISSLQQWSQQLFTQYLLHLTN